MDSLLARLSKQQALLEKQKNSLSSTEKSAQYLEPDDSIDGSVPLTPATDSFSATPGTEDSDADKTIQLDPAEVIRLKKELDAAKDKIARQEQELSQTRIIKHTLDQARTSTTSVIPQRISGALERTNNNVQDTHSASARSGVRQEPFGNHDDARSDISDAVSAGASYRGQNMWQANTGSAYNSGLPAPASQHFQPPNNIWAQGGRAWGGRPMPPPLAPLMMPQQQSVQHRTYSGHTSPVSGGSRFGSDFGQFQGAPGVRRSNTQSSRSSSNYTNTRNNGWDAYGNSVDGSMGSMISANSSFQQPMGMYQAPITYQPRPIGTPLSPTAAEFTAGSIISNPWNSIVRISFMQDCGVSDI